MRISVRCILRSSRQAVLKNADGSLKVYLNASPVRGKANKALCEILAEYYNVRKNDVSIISGHTSKNKIVEIMSK